MNLKLGFWLVLFNLFFKSESQNVTVTDKEYASMPSLFQFDDYDRCMLDGDNALYCYVVFQLYPTDKSNTSKIWNIIETVSSHPYNYRHDILRHGICITETCVNGLNQTVHLENGSIEIKKAVTECYRKKYLDAHLQEEVLKLHCENQESPYAVDTYDILFATISILYATFVIFSSLYEGIARYKSKEEYNRITQTSFGKFISAFSIPKNFSRLRTTSTNPDNLSLRCIQGIRFYNMTCVILVHTIMVQFSAPLSNPNFTEKVHTEFLNSFLTNGGYAVQTFFLISAWLLTYNIFSTFEGKKSIKLKNLVMIFVCRYVRLTPTLVLVVMFHSTWLVRLSRGPFWDKIIGEEYRNCRKNWWTNLLYINNYVNKEEMCLQQTWYLASDTQLFLVFLVIIYIMKTFERYLKYILGIIIGVGIIIPSIISYYNNYDILIRQFPEPLFNYMLFLPQWHNMYTASYSNITGYGIGAMFGYIFYKTKDKNFTITKFHVILWWILSFGLPLSIILIAGRMYQEDYSYTRLESALYWGFGKPIFAVGLGIGIFGMTKNIGWFCLWFCRWPPAQFLGRLTFSAYLIHVGWIKYRLAINRHPIYTNQTLLLHNWLGDVVMAYVLATILTLFIEMPISALQKLVLQRQKY